MRMKLNMTLAGLAFVLLAGCSEEEQLAQITERQTAAAKSATAHGQPNVTAVGQNAALLHATLGNGGEGWAEGDSIWTYTLQSLYHNSYVLSSGVGSPTADFSRRTGSDDYLDGSTVYAVSSTKHVYGFSATGDGGALLSVTIPNRYMSEEIGAPEGCSRMPVPFWGMATFGKDGCLETELSGLTALLKVDVSALPAETRALVLTTHFYTDLIGTDTEPEEGDGEPLSGTFDTILKSGAQLATNPIFYSYDTLRVDLAGASAYRHLFIPVVAASYRTLHVIAVTGDSRYAYEWQGRVLKTYRRDTHFRPNTIEALEPESTGIRTPKI